MNQKKLILLEKELNDIQKEVRKGLVIISRLIKDMTGEGEAEDEDEDASSQGDA